MKIFKAKKIIKIALVLAIASMVAACGTAPENGNGETAAPPEPAVTTPPPPHQGMIPPAVDPLQPIQQTTPPDEPIPDLFPPSGYYFTLTAEERAAYERLVAELSTDAFYGLSPISVAKIYIQAGIDGEWEAEFIAHNQESMRMTREDWQELHEVDQEWSVIESRQSLANWVFPFLDDAEVIIDGDRATLHFYSVPDPEELEFDPDFPGEPHVFNLIRNDRGIWEARFRPHAFDVE